jgi:hypothetical protein
VTNSSLDDIDLYSQQESKIKSPLVDTRFVESVRDIESENGPYHLRSICHLREDNVTPNEPDNGSEYPGDRTNC